MAKINQIRKAKGGVMTTIKGCNQNGYQKKLMGEELNIIKEMIATCTDRIGEREIVIKAMRAVCVWFGGQQIYIPSRKLDGSPIAEELRGVLADAVGEPDGKIILSELMNKFGGVPLYIPLESKAFKSEIAKEIKARCDGTMETIRDLSREYKISFTQIYRLWHLAREEENQLELPF